MINVSEAREDDENFKNPVDLMFDELEQQITAYNLACHGMGAAFIGDLLLRRAQTAPGLAYYKLDDTLATRDVNFYYKHSRPMTRAVTEFLRLQQTNDEVKG